MMTNLLNMANIAKNIKLSINNQNRPKLEIPKNTPENLQNLRNSPICGDSLCDENGGSIHKSRKNPLPKMTSLFL